MNSKRIKRCVGDLVHKLTVFDNNRINIVIGDGELHESREKQNFSKFLSDFFYFLQVLQSLCRQEQSGVKMIGGEEKSVHFVHAPLSKSAFLRQKFEGDLAPAEVNLSFKLVGVKVDDEENMVRVEIVNEKEINVYLLLGGEEIVSQTGLTLQITNIRYMQKVEIRQPSPPEGQELVIVPSAMRRGPLFIIIQPCLLDQQTVFILHRETYSQQEKTYRCLSETLMWCSLSFQLQEIYGAKEAFKCGELCSICLQVPANVILTPCRHMCLCLQCSQNYKMREQRCPICRRDFRATIDYR